MKRLTATIHGRVQGVSFRYYTQMQANKLGLSGWVRNERDGTVRVVAEGETNVLEAFESWLHTGSPAALVRKVDSRWEEATGEFDLFRVRF